MTISFYGGTCIRMEARGTVLVSNPFGKELGLTPPRFEAAVVIASSPSYAESRIAGNPYIVSGPGEYDIRDITIQGFEVTASEWAYVIGWDELVLLHLGELAEGSEEDVEKMLKEITDEIDVLFLPVGGKIGAKAANTILQMIEPHIVIPTAYQLKTMSKGYGHLVDFTKLAGNPTRKEERISVKEKDLEGKNGELVELITPYGVL